MTASTRLSSIDVVRGAVMVLMAIDHVRVYSGVPAGGPTLGIFFTRWITHFCAPAFVFLAGTSAFLYRRKLEADGNPDARAALAWYLVTRGALLVALEFTVVRASWTFGVDYSQFILAGVIWMLGCCMVLLAALIWLPVGAIAIVGLTLIVAQNLFGSAAAALGGASGGFAGAVWQFIYLNGEVPLGQGGPTVTVLYTIVPWIGVMAVGYAFGAVMAREPARRDRLCYGIGLSASAAFVVIAGAQLLTGPAPDEAPPLIVRLLNQNKYPASQLFLLMTLGPTIALLPAAGRARGRLAEVLATFGRVPMFYYLLHIPVIHAVSRLVWIARDGTAHGDWFATAPYVSIPAGQRWSLPLLYLVFVISVALLYPPCRWYRRHKTKYI